jgi:hypothetical protein
MSKFIFEEDDLESLFVCLNCKKRIISPRCLPCGENICMPCLETLINEENKSIMCPYCSELHLFPEDGSFPENLIIVKYLKKFGDKFTKSKLSEHLTLQLKALLDKKKEIEELEKFAKQKILDNTDLIRKSINEVTAEAHAYLDEQKCAFINQVREYEIEAENNWVGLEDFKEYFENVLEEITSFHDKWLIYLTKFTINEIELSKACIQAQDCLHRLDKEMFKMKEKIFQGKVLTFTKFKEGMTYDAIGSLSVRPQNQKNLKK